MSLDMFLFGEPSPPRPAPRVGTIEIDALGPVPWSQRNLTGPDGGEPLSILLRCGLEVVVTLTKGERQLEWDLKIQRDPSLSGASRGSRVE